MVGVYPLNATSGRAGQWFAVVRWMHGGLLHRAGPTGLGDSSGKEL